MTVRDHLSAALGELDQLETERIAGAAALAELEARAGDAAEITALRVSLDQLRLSVTDPERGQVEVATCSKCGNSYPEWVSVKTSECPDCLTKAPDAGARSIRHDSAPEVLAAALAYGALAGYAAAAGEPVWPLWTEAPSWRASWLLEAARNVRTGIARSAEDLHLSWQAAREIEGWRNGRSVDPVAHRHPNMVLWGALSDAARTQYRLQFALIAALITG